MSTAKNDITGDTIITRSSSENYRQGWDRIFGKKEQHQANTSPSESATIQHETDAGEQ